MIKRAFRLPAAIRLHNARLVHTAALTIKIAKNELPHNRFSFVISKKVAKNAVDRNRSRRRVRAHFEEKLAAFPQGFDMLIIIKKNLSEVDQKFLQDEIALAFKKGGLV